MPVIPHKNIESVTFTTHLDDIAEKVGPFYYHDRIDLSLEEKESISTYRRDSSKINWYLRGNYIPADSEKEILDHQISDLSNSFSKKNSRLPDDIDVIKGVDFPFAMMLLKNGGIRDHAFSSTSYNLNDAISYAQCANDNSEEHDEYLNLVAISLSKGTKFLYLKEDAEILLDKDSSWHVIDAREFDTFTYVTVSDGVAERRKYDKVRIIFINREEGEA